MHKTRLWVAATAVWLFAAALVGAEEDLPVVQPEAVGFAGERLDQIESFFETRARNGEIAGIVTLVARHGKIAHFSAVGYADAERKLPMERDTIFRIYSMTKPIASTALMMLYQDGKFQLTDPLSKYIPEFAELRVLRTPDGPLDETVAMVREPTVQDALRHYRRVLSCSWYVGIRQAFRRHRDLQHRNLARRDDDGALDNSPDEPTRVHVSLQRGPRRCASYRRGDFGHGGGRLSRRAHLPTARHERHGILGRFP